MLLALLFITAWTSPLFAAQPKTQQAQPKVQQVQPKPQYGGILRVSDLTDGTNIGLPSKYSALYAQRQVAPAIETLFRTDKTGKPIPWLAESYKEDAKGKTITLKLRKGVKFHDGTDLMRKLSNGTWSNIWRLNPAELKCSQVWTSWTISLSVSI